MSAERCNVPLDVRLVASLISACGLPSHDDAAPPSAAAPPLAARVLASVLLAVCGARAGRTRLLHCAAAALAVALPDCAIVHARCGRASAARAPDAAAAAPAAAHWLACPAHEALLARARPARSGSPALARAHAAVAAARARAPARACAVLVDDADALDGGGGGGAGDETGALGGQAALAVLCCVWQCPACLAVDDAALLSGAAAGAPAAGAAASAVSGSVAVLLTASSLALLDRAHFALPSVMHMGGVAWAPCIARDWLPGAMSAGGAAALAASGEPARLQLERAAQRAAEDPNLAAAEARLAPPRARAVVDAVCELLPPAELRGCAVRVPQRGMASAQADLAGLRAAVFLPPDDGDEEKLVDGESSSDFFPPAWARAWPAAAPAAPPSCPPATGIAGAGGGWEELIICATAKAALHRAVVLPILAWQAARAGGGGSGDGSAPPAVLAMAAAMAAMRVSPPSGVLLHGPPGCGKSTVAAALARACRMRLLVVDAGLVLAKYVGDSEASLRALYRLARRASPCCLVFENFQVVGGDRGSGGERGAASVHDRMLATLLTELDGVGVKRGEADGTGSGGGGGGCVLTVAIAECEADIDAALLRTGRLGVRVELPLPAAAERSALLARFAADAGAAPDASALQRLAAAADGSSGAALRLWAQLAADAAASGGGPANAAHFAAAAPEAVDLAAKMAALSVGE